MRHGRRPLDFYDGLEAEFGRERKRLGQIIDRPAGHARRRDLALPLIRALRRQEALESRLESLAVDHACGVGREVRVRGKLRSAQHGHESAELPIVAHGDHERAVCRREDFVGRDRRMSVAEDARYHAGRDISRSLVDQCREERGKEIHFHALTLTRRVAVA